MILRLLAWPFAALILICLVAWCSQGTTTLPGEDSSYSASPDFWRIGDP